MASNNRQTVLISTVLVGIVLAFSVAPSQAGDSPVAQTTPIKPASVMGDKNRSGPDGWVQAPVTRDQSPAAASSEKAAGEPAQSGSKAIPPSEKPMNPGDDPGTPIATPSTGPGRANAASTLTSK